MQWYDVIFDLIDMRSFSNLWYWIVLAVMWSSVSHWVLGVPFDMISRARRYGGQAQADLEALVRITTGRLLHITRTAGSMLIAVAAFVVWPLAGMLMLNLGWAAAMQVMGLLVLIALPAAFLLKGNAVQVVPVAQAPVTTLAAIRTALQDRSYLMLAAGFTVCGFHVAFLATHLPGVIASCGLPLQFGAWSLALIGLFNIIGSISVGWAVGRWRMKSLLSLVYAARALAVLVFLFAPKTGVTMLVFAAVMGLTFLSTVPPTAEIGRASCRERVSSPV